MRTRGFVLLAAASTVAACSPDDEPADVGVDASQDVGKDAARRRPSDAATDPLVDAPVDVHDAGTASDAGLEFDCSGPGMDAGIVPDHLACTGLYAHWPSKTIAQDVRAFQPGVELWSDGAAKTRWIYLPPKTQIDTSNMDEWVFPTGTKFWKEFRLGGKRIETRLLWKRTGASWVRTTYRWTDDETDAVELTTGELNVDGTGYEIPSQAACTTCHQGRIDGVLGFEAIGLSLPGATGLTPSKLVEENLVTHPPTIEIGVPGTGNERLALTWLHGNCGNICHNRSPAALAGGTGLWMRLDVERLTNPLITDTYRTAVNVVSRFQPIPSTRLYRIRPGDSVKSAIPFRVGHRDTQGERWQMPPIDSHVVDKEAEKILREWIDGM